MKDKNAKRNQKTKRMKRNIKSLTGFKMGAVDGEIGQVEEFYFDDKTWTIRYIIVNTGSWLSNRKVLISPEAVVNPDWKQKVFPVNLTKEQIKNSPDIDTDKPVSRQQEIRLHEYYPWRNYWSSGLWSGGIVTSGMQMPPALSLEEAIPKDKVADRRKTTDDPNLRSTDKVIGYDIEAIDGDIGKVEDFIIDDTTWRIHFMLVDTGNWFPGKKVLISPKWVKEIKWANSSVKVNVPVEHIKKSPEYDPRQEVSDSYEANLKNYYGRYVSE